MSPARLASDPPGRLTLRETVLVEGEGVQNVMRWEDYTQTAMDPGDDCTIWYVGDYLKQGAACVLHEDRRLQNPVSLVSWNRAPTHDSGTLARTRLPVRRRSAVRAEL